MTEIVELAIAAIIVFPIGLLIVNTLDKWKKEMDESE